MMDIRDSFYKAQSQAVSLFQSGKEWFEDSVPDLIRNPFTVVNNLM
jgi:hypothetical protein